MKLKSQNSQRNTEGKNKVEDRHSFTAKLTIKLLRSEQCALVKKYAYRSMKQDRDPRHRSTQLTLDKGEKAIQWSKNSLFKDGAGTARNKECKQIINLETAFISFTENNDGPKCKFSLSIEVENMVLFSWCQNQR